MNIDPLKVDSNFCKDNCVFDSSEVMWYIQITKMVDKTILTVDFEAKTSKRITIGDIGNVLMTQMRIANDEVLGITKYFLAKTRAL